MADIPTIPTIAAQAWATTFAPNFFNRPVEFGHAVALVEKAARVTQHHAGDEVATAAALAALSVRPEVLQVIARLASLDLHCPAVQTQTDRAGGQA